MKYKYYLHINYGSEVLYRYLKLKTEYFNNATNKWEYSGLMIHPKNWIGLTKYQAKSLFPEIFTNK